MEKTMNKAKLVAFLTILIAVNAFSALAQIPGLPRIRPSATPTRPTTVQADNDNQEWLKQAPNSDFHFIGESHMDGRDISTFRVCAPGMRYAPPVARDFSNWSHGIKESDAWETFEQGSCKLVVYGVGQRYNHKSVDSLGSLANGNSVYVVERRKLKLVKDFSGSSSGGTTAVSSVAPQGKEMLVFSKSPIDPANPSNLTNVFTAGDHIYGLLILSDSLKEFAKEMSVSHKQFGYNVPRPALEIIINIDGSPIYDGNHFFAWDIENKDTAWDSVPNDRYFFFDVAPDASKAKTYAYPKMHFEMLSAPGRSGNAARAGAQYYSHHLGQLKSGNHKIEFTIKGESTIKGAFSITSGNYAFYTDAAAKLDAAGAENAVIPPPKLNNAALENSIRAAVRARNTDPILCVSITNPDWFVQRNALGQILFRGIYAVTAHRKADGTCYFYQSYFKQNYAGGRYGATQLDGGGGTRTPIVCANVNK